MPQFPMAWNCSSVNPPSFHTSGLTSSLPLSSEIFVGAVLASDGRISTTSIFFLLTSWIFRCLSTVRHSYCVLVHLNKHHTPFERMFNLQFESTGIRRKKGWKSNWRVHFCLHCYFPAVARLLCLKLVLGPRFMALDNELPLNYPLGNEIAGVRLKYPAN